MTKLIKYDTVLKPFYIVLSDDLRFHALYGDISIAIANSLSGAIDAIPNKHLYGLPNNAMDWQRLHPLTTADSTASKESLGSIHSHVN